MANKLLIVHGGGPSPVINSTLYGVLRQAKLHDFSQVIGAVGGTKGVLDEQFVRLDNIAQSELEKLTHTPGSAIGTSRYPIENEDYLLMKEVFLRNDIGYVLINGGNGTMHTCGKLHALCKESGVIVVGIPKTVDNDIAITDHTPGFGSAARFIAGTTREVGEDVRSMPIHVSIIEAMGRNVGWLTAASALARKRSGDAPHLIYVPEHPFYEEKFLEDVLSAHKTHGGVVVVASEGLTDKDGKPIVEPIEKNDRAVYFGEVGAHLANTVVKKLKIKARSEKPGISARASMPWLSKKDVQEAILTGEVAVKTAYERQSGVMVGFKRSNPGEPYSVNTTLIPINDVMLVEKKLPREYINDRKNDVTQAFIDWCTPLIGGAFDDFIRINKP